MSYKIRYRFLLLNARLLRNMLAIIGMAGILSSCSGSGKKEHETNQDSLNKVKEQHRLDSIAKVQSDSIAKAKTDSLEKAYDDSLNAANVQIRPRPTVTKYGVPFEPNDQFEPTKYGVQVVH